MFGKKAKRELAAARGGMIGTVYLLKQAADEIKRLNGDPELVKGIERVIDMLRGEFRRTAPIPTKKGGK